MRNRKFLLLILFILFNLKAFPAVFVVNSNADSGPGTLRDALTLAAANGSAEKDYVNFNLPDVSEAGRTINILTQLPLVSSNLIIDGTTQPGLSIKMSDAKITITTDRNKYRVPGESSAGLILNEVSNVEIYGLFITGFNGLIKFYGSNEVFLQSSGIDLNGVQNIIIGAPGKGNLFTQDDAGIQTISITEQDALANAKVKVQSNYFGYVNPDGTYTPIYISLYTLSNAINTDFTFGGDDPALGNHSLGGVVISGNNCKVINNFFALDKDGNVIKVLYNYYLQPDINDFGSTNTIISNNKWGKVWMHLHGTSNFEIISNTALDPGQSTIEMNNCENGLIGTDDINKENLLQGAKIISDLGKNVQIRKNSIICTDFPYSITEAESVIPDINVLVNNNTEYSGNATPNSVVYIYDDNTDCDVCNPVQYFATVIADANGNWKITGDYTNKKLVANTTFNQNSSQYTIPYIAIDHNFVVSPSCGLNNGSLRVITTTKQVLKIEWYNSNGEKIGQGNEVDNLGPGTYYARGINGKCSTNSQSVIIFDSSVTIDDRKIQIINPACNAAGSITKLFVNANLLHTIKYSWTDNKGIEVSNKLNPTGLLAGKYMLLAKDITTGCTATYGPVTLTNTTGPTIDQSQQQILSSNCGQATGSITNIQVSGGAGTYNYIWRNDQQQTVGTDKDLVGMPAGTYKLQVTDGGQCGPIYSTEITIPETNGITLDETKATTSPATCGLSNGSITGIVVSGATTYTWTDATGKVTTTPTPDLTNSPAGTYTLTASNATCNKTSASYTIVQPPPTQYPVYQYTSENTCVNASTGFIKITVDDKVASLRWVNGVGQTAGTTAEIDNLAGGTYQLYLTDAAGCEILYNSYTIGTILPLAIIRGSEQKIDDQCASGVGSIKNITVEGGITPYTFSWTDSSGKPIAQTADLLNVGAGSYTLLVTDASGCGSATNTYVLQNQDSFVSPPVVNDVQLCSPGSAILQVKDPSKNFSYRLYDSESNPAPVAEQANGIFKINADANSRFYVSQFSGDCESTRTPVHINIGIAGVDIANTFTPNGDGINDYWEIKNITNYPGALIQIFTRNGQKVFESKGYPIPFNGTYNGKKIPDGVYYYLINLGIKCNLLSGSLTVIR